MRRLVVTQLVTQAWRASQKARESPSRRRLQIVQRPTVRAHSALGTESLICSRLTAVSRYGALFTKGRGTFEFCTADHSGARCENPPG